MLVMLAAVTAAAALGLTGRSAGSRTRLAVRSDQPRADLLRRATPGVTIAAIVVGGVVAIGSGLSVRLLSVGIGGVAATIGLVRRSQRRRRRIRARSALPDAAFAIAAELRSGGLPAQALLATAAGIPALHDELTTAARASPGEIGDALGAAAGSIGATGLRALGAVLDVAGAGGAAVADILDRLGEALDDDLAAAAQVSTLLAGPRATAGLLAGLPLLGLGLGQAIGADPIRLLLHQPLGWALSLVALGLDVAGALWTMRIVRAAGTP